MAILDLLDATDRGDVVLFVGAGISLSAGLPNWISLIRPLAEMLGTSLPNRDQDVSSQQLVAVAQMWENSRGRNSLLSYLREKLDGSNVQFTPVHQLIATSPVKMIFTTNYDCLLERAFGSLDRPYHVTALESDLPFWHEDEVQVVKLCGSIDRLDSILVTSRDFNTYFTTRHRLAERLRMTMESKALLIIGYSMQDPFFNQLWDTIGLEFGALRRNAFAVLFDPPQPEYIDLTARGIEVIDIAEDSRMKTNALHQWLGSLWTSRPRRSS